jgi:hypothetical protein
MAKEQIKDLIETKKNYQHKLVEIFKKYYIKYIEKLFEKSIKLRPFQEKLLKIPSWSHDKIEKEYNKFLTFVNDKYDLSEAEITKILHIVYGLNIKIMISICDEIEVNAPKLIKFWYNCIKRIGKYYYEHPKMMLSDNDFKKTKTQIEESINYTLHKFLPLKEIITSKNKQPQDTYNFDNGLGDTVDTLELSHKKNDSENVLEVTLESESDSNINSHDLKYISSKEFENEYYVSDKDNKNNKDNKEKSEEKHIKMPKYLFPKKTTQYKNKLFKNSQQTKNELDEHFFDDI